MQKIMYGSLRKAARIIVCAVIALPNALAYAEPANDVLPSYSAVSLGTVKVDYNDAQPLGVVAYSRILPVDRYWLREFAVVHAVGGGEYKDQLSGDSQYHLSSAAVYLIYRQPFTMSLYGKIKGGILYEHVSSDNDNNSYSGDGIGGSAGVALGSLIGDFQLELTYLVIEKNASMLSLGISW